MSRPFALTPKLTDFGLAKRLGADAGHTATGEVIGTPAYMAPEQARGDTKAIGPACDVYALGAILYEALTGKPPFRGGSLLETLRQVLSDEPVPPRRVRAAVPRDLEAICLKCLEKKPAHRYASADALADDLHRFVTGLPVEAQRGIPARALKWARRHPLVLAALSLMAGAVAAPTGMGYVERERQRSRAVEVAPQAREILQRHCYECHGDAKAERKLHVFNRATMLDPNRKNVVPGDTEHSRLIQRIRDGSMPPEDDARWLPRVSEEELSILKEWILGGAPEFPPEDPQRPTPPVVPRSELAAEVYGIFRERCLTCHKGPEAGGGIRILNHNLLLQRLVVIPGRPKESEVYRLLLPDAELRMPPRKDDEDRPLEPLTQVQIDKIEQWIRVGAPPFPHVPREK